MRIKKWEEIINPKTYRKKPGEEKDSEDAAEAGEPESPEEEKVQEKMVKTLPPRRKETVEQMFERRSVQSELGSHDEEDRKMGVKDFNLEKDRSESNISRVKALAQTYPFMFEQDFLDELKKLEEDKRKEDAGQK